MSVQATFVPTFFRARAGKHPLSCAAFVEEHGELAGLRLDVLET